MVLKQKGITRFLILILILIGIGVGIYLVQNPTIFTPKASTGPTANSTLSPVIPNLAFVFTGESNSGGFAYNGNATTDELAPTPTIKILNNQSLYFEDLDIGTNNLIDHYGLTPTYSSTTHGFELQLANLVKANTFPNNPQVYLVKTGQGMSTLSQWNAEGTFWTKFQTRIAAAKSQIPQPTQWIVWYSLGINDLLANPPTSTANFKTTTAAHLNKIKTELPGAIIIMTQFQAMGTSFENYNTALSEIAASTPNVYVVATGGTTVSGDGYHWDYQGFKNVVSRMVEATKIALAKITISGSPNPCNLNGATTCTSQISWNFPEYTDFKITIKENPGSLFTTNSTGSQTAPWIGVDGATFEAYSGNTLLARLFVRGIASGSNIPTSTPSASGKIGDINNDGSVNVLDLNYLITDYPSRNLRSDVDHDGDLDIFDVNLLITSLD